jgi:hypothetical protein
MPVKSKLEPAAAEKAAPTKTLSIPEAGYRYFGLSKNGAYDAASRGEIPFLQIGRLKRVSVARMDALMLEGGNPHQPIETPAKPVAKPSKSKYPPSAAMRRRSTVAAE